MAMTCFAWCQTSPYRGPEYPKRMVWLKDGVLAEKNGLYDQTWPLVKGHVKFPYIECEAMLIRFTISFIHVFVCCLSLFSAFDTKSLSLFEYSRIF